MKEETKNSEGRVSKKKKKAEEDPIESFDYEWGFSLEEVYD